MVAIHDMALGSRLGPAVYTAVILVGVWIASPAYFLALVPFALIGVIWGRHPLDVIYSELLAPLLGRPAIPKCGRPRRLAGLAATLWLLVIAFVFRNGPSVTGGLLAGLLAAGMFMTAALDLCLPCFVYVKLFVKPATHWSDEPTLRR